MTIYSPPPPSRTFRDDKPTLLVCWWCTSFAAAIILFRVAGRYIRTERLFKEDWIAFACLAPLFIRMGFVHMVLLYGTNNMDTDGIGDDVIAQRVLGSRLVLGSRIFYAATLWMLKLTISEYFKRLTPLHLWKPSYERTFLGIRWFFLISFIGVFISDLAECQPIDHYWQVTPDPGPQCRQGYAQLITMGVANVITDLLLILFPIPIIVLSTMNIKRKIQLTGLFGLSVFPIVCTLVRIPNIVDRQGNQAYRSLWASIEILTATAVANALVLGSFVRDRGVKKLKYKFGSTTDSIDRNSSRRGTVQQHWGSDEDLVRDLGLGVNRELRGGGAEESSKPRLAPMASGGKYTSTKTTVDRSWRFPEAGDAESDETDMVKFMNEQPHSPGDVSFINSPRKVSFFDVGGLLESDRTYSYSEGGGSLTASMSHESSRLALAPTSTPTPTRKGPQALLQDLGGLLSTGPSSLSTRTPKAFQRQAGMELQNISTRQQHQQQHLSKPGLGGNAELQDVGGLLKMPASRT